MKTNEELTPELQNALAELKSTELDNQFYENLQTLVESAGVPEAQRSHIRPRYWVPALTTAAAAVIAIALVSSSTMTGSPTKQVAAPTTVVNTTTPLSDFHPTLASQVLERASIALGSATGIAGTSTTKGYCENWTAQNRCDGSHPSSTVTQFRFDDKGDKWTSSVSNAGTDPVKEWTNVFAYNAASGAYQTLGVDFKPGAADPVAYTTGVDPILTARDSIAVFGNFDPFAVLNGDTAAKNATLTETNVGGRPAWSVHASVDRVDPEQPSVPNDITVLFDKESLFPLSIVEKRDGQTVSTTAIGDFVVNPTFKDADFVVAKPAGARVEVAKPDTQTVRVTAPADIAAQVSYKPLLPAWVPDGYKLSAITVAKDAGASGVEGTNTYNRDVVVLLYRRGLQKIEFTTRLVGPKPDAWVDPYSSEHTQAMGTVENETFKVQGGAYNEVDAHLYSAWTAKPHVYVIGATLVTTVYGDATPSELKQILGSAQRQP